MNDDLVFIKTPTGEDAVRDRTRLVQRNLRMVLILVDGLTKVSALKQKAGDPSMIETALAELERIGLIESTETRGTKQASAVAEALSITDDAMTVVPEELFHEVPTIDTVFEEFSPPVSTSVPVNTSNSAAVGVPSIQAGLQPGSLAGDTSEGWISRLKKRWRHIQEERTYERAYGTRTTADDNIEAVPSRRLLGRRRLKLKTVLSLILLAGIVIGVARILFYPYDSYRPGIEAELTRVLGEPVSIERVNLEFSPLPSLMLRGVTVGASSDAVVDQIALIPSPGYIFGGPLVQTAKVTGMHLRENALGQLDKWLLRENMLAIPVEQVTVENLSVDLGWTRLQGLSGFLRSRESNDVLFVGKFGEPKSDGRFEVSPTARGLKISVQAGAWSIPIEPPIHVDALDFFGHYEKGQITVEKMDMRAFDGAVGGTGLITWGGNAKMTLDMTLKHVSSLKLLEALRAPALLDGELAGRVQYANLKPTHNWLTPDATAVANVSVLRGSLKRIDLAGALKASTQQTLSFRGGDTGFEEFAGKISFDAGGATRVSDVRLSSGLMVATGQATFPWDTGIVKGAAIVEMRGSARAPRATIAIGGSARDPQLKVSSGSPRTGEPRVQEKPGDTPQVPQ